ncbi:uncharacterized protein PFL1_03889 [Pseudozyma flocculosa PF-1]|uniref:Uncharacterized protein n=2 Tax=Pseudozyma flocculosa TaxID=84751 RepID=A0A5C3EW72_9BASI|nr:uncharacterized protein PFL1_03889 [Pseudozyma flocculosa PF-1]EPQ28585.1 hypothetical protein PFL1_03889 [Pseudozyma flocculosa PF-1]SPO36524.1 uncharacterized protein PSFLO_01995 [Pseudozyma flocculosa]
MKPSASLLLLTALVGIIARASPSEKVGTVIKLAGKDNYLFVELDNAFEADTRSPSVNLCLDSPGVRDWTFAYKPGGSAMYPRYSKEQDRHTFVKAQDCSQGGSRCATWSRATSADGFGCFVLIDKKGWTPPDLAAAAKRNAMTFADVQIIVRAIEDEVKRNDLGIIDVKKRTFLGILPDTCDVRQDTTGCKNF